MYTCLYHHHCYFKISPCKAHDFDNTSAAIMYSYSRSVICIYLYSDVFEEFGAANSLLSDISRLSDDGDVSE